MRLASFRFASLGAVWPLGFENLSVFRGGGADSHQEFEETEDLCDFWYKNWCVRRGDVSKRAETQAGEPEGLPGGGVQEEAAIED